MTDVLKISGDDLRGAFDFELTADSPLIITDVIGGLSWRRVLSSSATKIIGKSPLGLTTAYFGFLYQKTGNPASSQVMLHPFTSGGATAFRLRTSSTGTIILDGAVTNTLDTSVALANNTVYAFVGEATASAVTITIYAANGSVVDTLSATNTFGVVDNWRMGQIGGSPALPDWLFRMLLVSTTAITPAMLLATPTAVSSPTQAFIGDSNLAMMGANSQYLYDELVTRGVSTRNSGVAAVGGKRIAAADLTGKTTMQNMDDLFEQLGTVTRWVFALGTNDRPQTDAVVNAAIDSVLTKVDALTPGAKVVWIGLTSKGSASADDVRVNNLLKAKLAARPNSVFADWDAYIRAIDGGDVNSDLWLTTDTTHMSPTGYPKRSAFLVDQVVEAAPSVEGSIAQIIPAVTSTSATAITPPPVSGSVAANVPAATSVVSASMSPPGIVGTITASVPAVVSAGFASVTPPSLTGAVTTVAPAVISASIASAVPPALAGVISGNVPAVVTAATGGIHDPDQFTGAIVAIVPAALSQAAATVGPPPLSGQVAATVAAVLQGAIATIVGEPASRMVFTPTTHRPGAVKVRPRPLSPPVWPPT